MKVTLDNIIPESISEHLKSYIPPSLETTMQALSRMSNEELQKSFEPPSVFQTVRDAFDTLSQNNLDGFLDRNSTGYLSTFQQNTSIPNGLSHDRFLNLIHPQISFHHSSEPPIRKDNQKFNKARFPWG